MTELSYHVPSTGISCYKEDGSWEKYYKRMPDFEKYDCFSLSSADFDNPLRTHFIEQTGINIDQFKEQVETQCMHPVSMGIFQLSRIIKYDKTNQLYLQVPQSGCGVLFKLYQK